MTITEGKLGYHKSYYRRHLMWSNLPKVWVKKWWLMCLLHRRRQEPIHPVRLTFYRFREFLLQECFPPLHQGFCFVMNFNKFLDAAVPSVWKRLFKFESTKFGFVFTAIHLKFFLFPSVVFSTRQSLPSALIMNATARLCCNEVELVDQLSMTCRNDCHFSCPSSPDTALAASSCHRELLRFHAGLMPLAPGDLAAVSTL